MSKQVKILFIAVCAVLVLSVAGGIVGLVLPDNAKTKEETVSTMGYGQTGDAKDLTNREKMVGYASVADYGADGTDKKDDTDAFEKAIAKNIGVFVPSGTYYINRPIAFNSQNLMGEGAADTVIVATIVDKDKPMVYLGGSSMVSMLTLSYDKALITGDEKRNERVAVSCGAAIGFGAGGGISDVDFANVGTAVRSDNSQGFGSNSCQFERINVKNVTHCGFDFTVLAGYGNIFSRINVSDSKAQSAFNFDGIGGTDVTENITLTDCEFEYGMGYTELSGVVIDQPTAINTKFKKQALVCTDK